MGGLDLGLTDADFRQYFSAFGELSECAIMRDRETGRSRGFGFATYAVDGAVDALFALGRMHDLGGRKIEIKVGGMREAGVRRRGGAS